MSNIDYLKDKFQDALNRQKEVIEKESVDVIPLESKFVSLIQELSEFLEKYDSIKASVQFIYNMEHHIFITIVLSEDTKLYISLYNGYDEDRNNINFSFYFKGDCVCVRRTNIYGVKGKINNMISIINEIS